MRKDPGNLANVVIIGGGLVGSLLAIFLARRGCTVRVFERKPDLRRSLLPSGRSINLTLCHRGFAALDRVGAGDAVRAIAIPAYGRAIHNETGEVVFQPYGNGGEALYSITRNELNRVLLECAEKEPGIELHFEHTCREVDFHGPAVRLECARTQEVHRVKTDMLFGTDGAFSAVRLQMQKTDRFDFSQEYIRQGYKELTVPAEMLDQWGLDRHALHIWPRGHFMLIGFANSDGSATLALHLPFAGEPSFASIGIEDDLLRLFSRHFPDAVGKIPNLAGNFFGRPVSSMLTVRCFPWVRGRVALIGDAAHAIVPSYGQGANAGFEDCDFLDMCLERYGGDWEVALAAFQEERKVNADAIADLSLQHFTEIRDRIADPRFLLRKAIERKLDELFPGRYRSLYSMISFTSLTYVQAIRAAAEQEALVDRILEIDGLEDHLAKGSLDEIIRERMRLSTISCPLTANAGGPLSLSTKPTAESKGA
jgi:kynurenine 3-monooxygenase